MTSAFGNIASQPLYLSVNVDTKMGFVCDAECLMEKNADSDLLYKPLPLRQNETLGSLGPGGVLPRASSQVEGEKRLALQVVSYQESLITGGKTGLAQLYRRLMESRGYVVLEIRHDFFPPKDNVVAITKKLLSKTQSVLAAAK